MTLPCLRTNENSFGIFINEIESVIVESYHIILLNVSQANLLECLDGKSCENSTSVNKTAEFGKNNP